MKSSASVGPSRVRDLLAVHVDRGARLLAGARQADADVGRAALARAVDDAAHHRHLQVGDARALDAPHRHALARGGRSMRWASSWKTVLVVRPQPGQAVTSGRKERRPEALQQLAADAHLDRAVAARLRA